MIALLEQVVIYLDFWGKKTKSQEKRDSSHPQADRIAGATREEKVGLLRSE